MDQPPRTDWHSLHADECLRRLDSRHEGLDEHQARTRLASHGPNRLPEAPRPGPLRRFLRQFHNVLLYVMLASSGVAAVLGHWVDAWVIFAAVVVNAFIGFLQEGKAEAALEGIRQLLGSRATVLRNGQAQEIDAADLVPGDVVLLASGDKVPADLRLLDVQNLKAEEAALTGESLAVEKDHHPVAPDAALGDRFGMAYSGTLVVYGKARGVVVDTGARTELGRINGLLARVQMTSTPLLRQIDHFGRWLALAILVLVVATFLLGTFWRGNDPGDMLMVAIALTASAIPEGLPAIITVMLALGVQRMARRQAIVRRLPAVETLGAVTVICSDKTGTLTRNEMAVQRVVCAERRYDVTGEGYSATGMLLLEGQPVAAASQATLARLALAAWRCNDARLKREGDAWRLEGDPTEGALLALAGRCAAMDDTAGWTRLRAIPFESEHRFMATLDRRGEACTLFLKGAPERIFELCRWQHGDEGDTPFDPDYWRRMANDTAARGLRLLALAQRDAQADAPLDFEEVERGGFTLLGLVGIIDPPREEAISAVAQCHAAGIRVKMITGDHADTARAIGARLGIGLGKPAMTGAEIAVLDDARLREVVLDIDVFARASPEHKLRLVQALQGCGEVVAMTGDGVNDAPALKRADVGVAMGLKGTEAAKEAADMVLADDNFATIGNAVREGRAVYDNLKKSILFLLPTNGGQTLVVVAAILLQFALPLTPVQILWINMVTSCTLGLALAAEPAEPGIMTRPPRAPGEAILSGFFVWRVAMVALLMMLGALGLFLWELERGTGLDNARTMAVNVIVVGEMFYLLSSRYLYASVLSWQGLTGNRWILASLGLCALFQMLYTYAPPLQRLFGSTGLTLQEWARVVLAGLLVLLGAELEKWVIRRLVLPRRAA